MLRHSELIVIQQEVAIEAGLRHGSERSGCGKAKRTAAALRAALRRRYQLIRIEHGKSNKGGGRDGASGVDGRDAGRARWSVATVKVVPAWRRSSRCMSVAFVANFMPLTTPNADAGVVYRGKLFEATKHCAQFLRDKAELQVYQEQPTKVIVGKSGCHVRGG